MKLRTIAFAASGILLLASALPAQTWTDLGAGSGTPPGIFNLSSYDGEVGAGSEVPEQPQLAVNPSLNTTLFVNSRRIVGEVAKSETRALSLLGGEWQLHPASTKGKVFPGFEPLVGSDISIAHSPQEFVAAMTGAPPLIFSSDAFASFYSTAGWGGRGTSLENGGITDTSSFDTQVYDVAIALDPLERAGVATSQGTPSRRGIYYRRLEGSTWVGLNNSDTTPIAASTTSLITNIQPSTYFYGAGPVVAYTHVSSSVNETVKVLTYNSGSNSWTGFGTSDTVGLGSGRHPKVVGLRNASSFYVAFENRFSGALKVMAWTGTQWQDRGDALAPWGLTAVATFDEVLHGEPAVPNFDIKLDATGRPIVAFRAEYPAGSGKYQIFASYRNASGNWIALGSPGTGEGTSNFDYAPAASGNAYGHYHPTVTLGPDSKPVVAWAFENGAINTRTVLVKKYSTAVNAIIGNKANAVALLLGNIPSDPDLLSVLDFNDDNTVDAGDVERLPN
ncbi:hypothetical protein IT570_04895 [Candidatus Sumerlaeota bacterium]|nr:hypothetical protein [Candidatus Sumerlaeota bacterium]